jgi:hypothetical protein
VFTDERAFATVVGEPHPYTGWFDVEYDDGRRALKNDERVISAARARATGSATKAAPGDCRNSDRQELER